MEVLPIGSQHVFDSAVLKDAEESGLIPAVEGGMTLLYGDEEPFSGGADLAICSQTHPHPRPLLSDLLDLRIDLQSDPIRSGSPELDRVRCGHGARRLGLTGLVHQGDRRRPIAVTV